MIKRLCRTLWIGLVIVTLALLGLQAQSGLRIDTSFTAMVPVAPEEQETEQVLEAARDQGDHGILLLLESPDEQQLEKALAVVRDSIQQHSDLLTLSSSTSLPESALELIRGHHFHLLSQAHHQQLASGESEEFLADAISNLYSAAGEFRLMDFSDDPFNTSGSFVEQKATQNLPHTSTNQRVINTTLRDKSQEHGAQQTLNQLFLSLQSRLSAEFSNVTLKRSGVYFFAQHAASEAKKDINFISTGSLLGMLCLLILVFRSIWPVVMPLLSIVVGVTSAFTVVHAVYGSVHVFTIVFGASLIGIVIDYSIHYFFHVAREQGETSDADRNHGLYRALLVSLISSVVGYGALALSGVELLEKIAVFSVCGVVASWLTVMSVSPWVERKVSVADPFLLQIIHNSMNRAAAALRQFINPLALIICLVISVVVVGSMARGQDDPRRFVLLPEGLLAESQAVAAAFRGIEPGRFLLVKGDTEQQVYDRLERFYQLTDAGKGLVSLLDWLPSPERQQQSYQLNAALYRPDGLVANLFDVLGVEPDAASELSARYTAAADKPLSAAALFGGDVSELPPLLKRGATGYYAPVFVTQRADTAVLVAAAAQMQGVEYVDSVADSIAQLKLQRQTSVLMLVLAYGVVALLLLLIYRRLASLKMLVLPACASVLTALILVLSGVPFTLFHTMAFFLILGLGMDYAVFLTEMTSDKQATLRAILLSALTSMLSFGLLSLSSVPVAQAFGITVFLGSCLNLVMSFALACAQHQPKQEHKSDP